MTDALTEAVDREIQKHGGLRPAARALEINPAYLWRLQKGEKRNPTAKVMRKLRVRKVEYFEHVGSPRTSGSDHGE